MEQLENSRVSIECKKFTKFLDGRITKNLTTITVAYAGVLTEYVIVEIAKMLWQPREISGRGNNSRC